MTVKDDLLIKGLLSKDDKIIHEFVKSYTGLLYKACNSILLNSDLIEEAVQDSFLKIIKSINKFDGRSSLNTWMYTIAYRTAIDYHRRIKINDDLDTAFNLQSNSKTDSAIEDKEFKVRIHKLISHLNEEDQKIVSLFYLEEFSMKEICEILNLSLSNVKVKLFRARKELSSHVYKYFDKSEIAL